MTSYERVESNQLAERTTEKFNRLIEKYAFKFHKRAVGLSSIYDLDDIRQEMQLTFRKCAESYKDDGGASFMNFVITCWYRRINYLLQRDQDRMDSQHTLLCNIQKDDQDFIDAIDSEGDSPEGLASAQSSFNSLYSGLSEQAQLLVSLLVEVPESISKQLSLFRAAAALRSNNGMTTVSKNTSMSFLFRLFDVSSPQRLKLRREIETGINRAFA